MEEEGLASETMRAMDWPQFDIGRTPQEDIDRDVVRPISAFFLRHTQKELWEGGVQRRVMVYPVNDARGVLNDPQLAEEGVLAPDRTPAPPRLPPLPGPFIKTEKGLCGVRGRAPMMGEHNDDVYGEELGISKEDRMKLKAAEII